MRPADVHIAASLDHADYTCGPSKAAASDGAIALNVWIQTIRAAQSVLDVLPHSHCIGRGIVTAAPEAGRLHVCELSIRSGAIRLRPHSQRFGLAFSHRQLVVLCISANPLRPLGIDPRRNSTPPDESYDEHDDDQRHNQDYDPYDTAHGHSL